MPTKTTDASGRVHELFAGHVCRVVGAVWLSSTLRESYLVQVFARWGSRAIQRYVQDSPLYTQAEFAPRAMEAFTSAQVRARSKLQDVGIVNQDLITSLDVRLRNLETTFGPDAPCHIVDFDTSEPNKSRCGWFFGHQAHIKMAHSDAMSLPRRQRCDVCWPSKDHSSSSSGSDASDVACRKRAGISECEKVREPAPKQECRSHATSSSSSTSSSESTGA